MWVSKLASIISNLTDGPWQAVWHKGTSTGLACCEGESICGADVRSLAEGDVQADESIRLERCVEVSG
jgi:hypothetical protein